MKAMTKTMKNSDTPEIARRWRDPAGTPGEVFVVAHRGAFLLDNNICLAENSIPAFNRASSLGCDMVEVDVHFTSDGTAVVLHDATLERTTTGSGAVASRKFDDIREMKLVHPSTRAAFECSVPTLEEVFLALGDTLMINVEIKTDISDIPKIAAIAAKAGVSQQLTVKSNGDDAAHLAKVADIIAGTNYSVDFIPVLVDSRDTIETMEQACSLFDLSCIECIVDYPFGEGGYNLVERLAYTADGGPLFSIAARRIAQENNLRQFINTLFVNPLAGPHQWNGGRDCQLARLNPDSVYGFWIAHGASVIQSDEPEYLLNWLRQSGFRTDGGN